MLRLRKLRLCALLCVVFGGVECNAEHASLAPHLASTIRSDLGCGYANATGWTRRVCFHTLEQRHQVPTATSLDFRLRLTVELATNGTWANACGDTLRVRFLSRHALVAPPGALARELACGRYAVALRLPPPGRQAASYIAEVRVVHINGEGMTDPPEPRLAPRNLVTDQDGPVVWNLAARVPGALVVPALPESPDDSTWEDDGGDGFQSANSAWWPDAQTDTSALAVRGRRVLPPCTRGDHAGAWRVHTWMYGDHPGDPFVWRPFECRYSRVAGLQLDACLRGLGGRVHFFGESTARQLSELMALHAATAEHYWPRAFVTAESPTHEAIKADTYHGMSTLLERALPELHALRGASPAPSAYVFLQGANDAARDSLAAFHARLEQFLTQLHDGMRNGSIPTPTRGVFWITAPVRHYKSGAGPGQVSCPDGGPASCVQSYPGHAFGPDGEILWTQYHGDRAHRLFGTLPRRRALNARAVARFSALFPEPAGHVVDFEALSAALPSDYCFDGEHWASVYDVWRHRKGGTYQGRSMATAELGNVLANVLCAGVKPAPPRPEKTER